MFTNNNNAATADFDECESGIGKKTIPNNYVEVVTMITQLSIFFCVLLIYLSEMSNISAMLVEKMSYSIPTLPDKLIVGYANWNECMYIHI